MLGVREVWELWKKNKYTVFVVIASSLAFMCIGSALGWTSPALVKLSSPDSPIPVSSDELSWIAAMVSVGGLTASIPYSYFLNLIGRKPMIVIVALIYLSGWITLIFSEAVSHLYLGRYLLGAAVGCTYSSVPVYIGEVVSANIRGAVVTCLMISQSVGALVSFVVGPLIPLQAFNTVSLIIPSLMFFAFLFMPETPYFLLRNGREKEAQTTLMKLRGSQKLEDVQPELLNIQKFFNEEVKSNFYESLKQLAEMKSRKAILIITVLTVGQQMSGVGALAAYMQSIFIDIQSPIQSHVAVIIAELLADVGIIITSIVMDRIGRKPLFSLSSLVCLVANLVLGTFYLLRSNQNIGSEYAWLAVLGVFVLKMGADLGLSSVPMVVTSEILPFNIKGLISAYFSFIQGATMGTVVKMYQVIKDNLGIEYSHFIFAISIVLSMTFIIIYMPETKNKTLLEIQQQLNGKKEKHFERKESYEKKCEETA